MVDREIAADYRAPSRPETLRIGPKGHHSATGISLRALQHTWKAVAFNP